MKTGFIAENARPGLSIELITAPVIIARRIVALSIFNHGVTLGVFLRISNSIMRF